GFFLLFGMYRFSFLIGMCLLITACQDYGTRKMAYELDRIADDASTGDFPYLNQLAADELRMQIANADSQKAFELQEKLAEQLLWAGETDEAIEVLENWLEKRGDRDTVTFNNYHGFELLALAYLRQGEQQNCLDHHNPASCIMPIEGDGVHQIRQGSEAAIEAYQLMLKPFPQDLQSRWLLNLAYMTLGEYPERVPEPFLIPPESFASDTSLPAFPDRAMELGVAQNKLAGGCAIADFDRDGDLDIFTTSFGLRDQVSLFLNEGEKGFRDATETAGLSGITSGLNVIQGDVNNDGLIDLFVLRGAWLNNAGRQPNSLLINMGNGTFADQTEMSGLLSFYPSQTAAFADVNLDGWLDLFIGNETNPDGRHPSELYINQGDGTFQEKSKEYGLRTLQFVKGVSFGDINNDRYPDLYVSVLGGKNRLFLNQGEEKGFVNIADSAGVSGPFFSFPTWFWDYDQDGWEDLVVFGFNSRRYNKICEDVAADYLGLPNKSVPVRLYRNLGNNRFEDVAENLGLTDALFPMGCNFGDLDQDGWLDMYVGTGAPDFMSVIPNRVYRNHQGERFQDVTTVSGFGQIQKGHAVAFGDLDNDGDEDIYTVIGGFFEGDIYPNNLLEHPGSEHQWIVLAIEGKQANRSAFGTRIHLVVEAENGDIRTIHRTVNTGGSFGASSPQLEIGLGKAKRILQISVEWPDEAKHDDLFEGVPLNRHYRIEQGVGLMVAPNKQRINWSALPHSMN
ncbi:MAG: FG-GAP-like repeat-containing protein, partial [Bacteroidota bacterium]